MKNRNLIWMGLSLAGLMAASCSGKEKTEDNEKISTVLVDQQNAVSVEILQKRTFNHELVSNGKMSARRQAELRFESSEVIAHIYVKNGEQVRQGQKLAELDKFRLEQALFQAEDALMKADLALKDLLIGQGYPADDFGQVPAETMKLAKVKSGYELSQSQYELRKRELEHATLTAPFDGVVANLFAKPHNAANTSEPFCTLIDSRGMEAEFTVLENEWTLLKMGDKVEVSPYAGGTSLEGRISEINPLVEVNGMVKVKATVNAGGKLFSGMNVKVNVQRSLGEQLVIPKTAVVLRSGKQVVFTLKDGKTAMWNYVETGLENATEYTVSDKSQPGVKDGLLEGDTVIVNENVNLAHETQVTVKETIRP
jgi:RND family efflux transporter MFP subunit